MVRFLLFSEYISCSCEEIFSENKRKCTIPYRTGWNFLEWILALKLTNKYLPKILLFKKLRRMVLREFSINIKLTLEWYCLIKHLSTKKTISFWKNFLIESTSYSNNNFKAQTNSYNHFSLFSVPLIFNICVLNT